MTVKTLWGGLGEGDSTAQHALNYMVISAAQISHIDKD